MKPSGAVKYRLRPEGKSGLIRLMTARFTFLAVLAAAVAGAAAVQPANPAAARRDLVERQKRQYESSLDELPRLEQHSMSELCRLRLVGSKLDVATPLKPNPNAEAYRADIEGIPEPLEVICSRPFPGVQAGVLFEVTLNTFPNAETIKRIHMLSRPEMLDVDMTYQPAVGMLHVILLQVPGRVRFDITHFGGAFGGDTENVNIAEPDFLTLRRRHPSETNRWLRPMLHELRQDSAFAPDPAAAWQVLASDWPLDAAAKEEITRRLPALGSPDFHVRRQAAGELIKLGHDVALAVMHMDRAGFTLQQNVELEEVLSHFKPLPDKEAAQLYNDPEFLLDCLYGDDPQIRRHAFERLKQVAARSITFDTDADDAARVEAVDALRARLFPDTAGHPTTQPSQ